MAYSVPSAAPSRPTTVTAASYLLYLLAALQVVGLIITVLTLSDLRAATEKEYAGTSIAQAASAGVTIGVVTGTVLGLLFAVGFVVLGVLNSKGKNPARIVTWVLGGLALCCFGANLISTAVPGALSFGAPKGDPSAPDPAEAARRIQESLPSWQLPVSLAVQGIAFLCLITAVILLAVPASNAYFRRRPPQQSDPAYPAYPPPPNA